MSENYIDDATAAQSLEDARKAMVERLSTLEVARKAEREKRKEESEALADPKESIASFLLQFSNDHRHVISLLEGLQVAPEESNEQRQTLQAALDGLSSQVFQMEKSSSDASYYLPSYDQKQCTAIVATLKQRIEAARSELLPKRKFAFSKKVSRVKGADMSSAAATANPVGATPVSAGGTSLLSGGGRGGLENVSSESAAVTQSVAPSAQDIQAVKEGRGLMGLKNKVVVMSPEQVSGHDFVLIDLVDCSVFLMGHLPALRLLGLKNTKVTAGPVTGACFVDSATDCILSIAAYQVRIHRTYDTDFYLRVRSTPIIEHTNRVRFAPFALAAGEASNHDDRDQEMQALLTHHKLGEDTSLFSQVEDFGWIKNTQSPNWSVLVEDQRMPPTVIPWAESR